MHERILSCMRTTTTHRSKCSTASRAPTLVRSRLLWQHAEYCEEGRQVRHLQNSRAKVSASRLPLEPIWAHASTNRSSNKNASSNKRFKQKCSKIRDLRERVNLVKIFSNGHADQQNAEKSTRVWKWLKSTDCLAQKIIRTK